MVFSIQVSVQPGFSGRCARFDLLGIPGGADVSREVENLRVATGERAQGTLEAESGMSGLPENTVIAWRGNGGEYSRLAPFGPSQPYPEYVFGGPSSESNPAYEGIRACFHMAGLDLASFGLVDWNPLGELIH